MERDNKREHHNALERNRRNHIKDNFERLKDALPMLAGEKASRSVVLNHATSFVETSSLEYDLLKRSVDSLGSEVNFLKNRLDYINECILKGTIPVVTDELLELINNYNQAASFLPPRQNVGQSPCLGTSHPQNGLINLPPLQTVATETILKEELTENIEHPDFSSEDDSEDEYIDLQAHNE